jgi:DNA-binding MarR family transcriptional regulator
MVDHDPDLTRLLDRLATAGLVTKERDEADRRVINVAITKAGLRVVEAATAAAQARIRDEFKSIPKSKLETLSDLLELVRGSAR